MCEGPFEYMTVPWMWRHLKGRLQNAVRTWMNGLQADQTCDASERWLYNGIVVHIGTCESKAESTSLLSRSLCLKGQFMGLHLTSVVTFSCTPERGENVCHAHRMCVIVVQHCRLHSVLSEMLTPFGIVLLETQWWEYRRALLLWTNCLLWCTHLCSNYATHNLVVLSDVHLWYLSPLNLSFKMRILQIKCILSLSFPLQV